MKTARRATRVVHTTMLDLIAIVSQHTRNEAETVAVIAEILRRGCIRVTGVLSQRDIALAA
jgi:hypothetical protein